MESDTKTKQKKGGFIRQEAFISERDRPISHHLKRDTVCIYGIYAKFCVPIKHSRGTQRQFSENICSEDDLRSRIFGTFVVKFFACLPLLGFSNTLKNGIIARF